MYHMLGTAAGPLIINVCRDWDGRDYVVTLNVFAVCCLIVSVCVLVLKQPMHPADIIDHDTLARTLAQSTGSGSEERGTKSEGNSPRKSPGRSSRERSHESLRPFPGQGKPM